MLCTTDVNRNLAAIRHGLGNQHTYEFIDGAIPATRAPGKDLAVYFDISSSFVSNELQQLSYSILITRDTTDEEANNEISSRYRLDFWTR